MSDGTTAPKDLIGFLDYYFVKKAPFQIPQTGRAWLVQAAPWIVVVLLILSLPHLLWLLHIGSPFTISGYRWGYYDGYHYPYAYWPWLLGLTASFVLMVTTVEGDKINYTYTPRP